MSIIAVTLLERPSLQWLKNTYFSSSSCAPTPLTASFTTQITNLVVSVNGLGSSDSSGTITSYNWNFGDGVTATGSIISHTYSAAGTYRITLIVTDSNSKTATATKSVTISTIIPPTAAFTSSANALTVAFNASTSTDSDSTIVTYSWNFGDSSQTGAGETISHTY